MAHARVDIYKAQDAQDWRWRLVAANGEIVASGEGYTTEEDARRGFYDAGENFDSARGNA